MSRVKAQGAACHRVKYLTTGLIPGVLTRWGGSYRIMDLKTVVCKYLHAPFTSKRPNTGNKEDFVY